MWTSPRETIRALVREDPTQWVILLAWWYGVASALLSLSVRTPKDDDLPAAFFVGLAFYMGPLGGFYQTYVAGIFASTAGRLFGGQATPEECRAAVAWGSIPCISGLLLWPPALVLIGGSLVLGHDAPVPMAALIFWVVQLLLFFWSLALQIGALAELHGISLWRMVAAAIVGWLSFLATLVGLVVAAWSLFGD